MDTTKKDKKNIVLNTNPDFEDYISTRLKETRGAVEATSSDVHEIYFRLQQVGHFIEQISDGIGKTIGTFYGHSVHVQFRWLKVDGVLICFYEATSRVVDHDMVKTFMKNILPHLKPGAFNDAMNVHNTVNVAGCVRTVESVTRGIKHIENEFKWQNEQLQKSLKIKIAERELELLKRS